MTSSTTTRKLTYEDYVLFPEDGQRHELIDGEHYVSPAPYVRHQHVVVQIVGALNAFARNTGCGVVLVAPTDVVLSQYDVVEPDVLYVSRERQGVVGEKFISGPPDLAVEVLSPSTRRRDLDLKLKLYERVGVQEYWIVDSQLATITVYRLGSQGFDPPLALFAAKGDVISSPLLPGLTLPLSDLLLP
jgi:Uma2 family endonuclease